MKLLTKLIIGFSAILITSSALADTLCAKKSVKANKKGRIAFTKNLRVVPDSQCPRGFTPLLDTSNLGGETGPQGPQGPRGNDGFVNLGSCRTELGENSLISGANDVMSVSLQCGQNEFLLTHGGITSDTTTSIISTALLYFPNEGFPSGAQYFFARLEPQNTTTVTSLAAAVCCAR